MPKTRSMTSKSTTQEESSVAGTESTENTDTSVVSGTTNTTGTSATTSTGVSTSTDADNTLVGTASEDGTPAVAAADNVVTGPTGGVTSAAFEVDSVRVSNNDSGMQFDPRVDTEALQQSQLTGADRRREACPDTLNISPAITNQVVQRYSQQHEHIDVKVVINKTTSKKSRTAKSTQSSRKKTQKEIEILNLEEDLILLRLKKARLQLNLDEEQSEAPDNDSITTSTVQERVEHWLDGSQQELLAITETETENRRPPDSTPMSAPPTSQLRTSQECTQTNAFKIPCVPPLLGTHPAHKQAGIGNLVDQAHAVLNPINTHPLPEQLGTRAAVDQQAHVTSSISGVRPVHKQAGTEANPLSYPEATADNQQYSTRPVPPPPRPQGDVQSAYSQSTQLASPPPRVNASATLEQLLQKPPLPPRNEARCYNEEPVDYINHPPAIERLQESYNEAPLMATASTDGNMQLMNYFERQQQMFLHGLTQLSQAVSAPANRGSHQMPPKFMSDLPIFAGAFDEFYSWRDIFKATSSHFSDGENKARLRRCLKGAARELVDGLFKTSAPSDNIIETLEEVYGRPDAIVYAELEKLKTLPRLTDAGKELPTFTCRVDAVVSTIQALKKEAYLVSPQSLHIIEEKMSPLYKKSWFDFEALQSEEEPGLLKIRRFLKQEMKKNTRHIICLDTVSRNTETQKKQRTMQAQDYKQRNTMEPGDNNEKQCSLCKRKGHLLSECRRFQEFPLNKRWEFCREQRVCFRCLKHRSFRHKCKSTKCEAPGCMFYHHKLLHRQPLTSNEDKTMGTTCSSIGTAALLKIIPVTISGPKGSTEVYAILDGGSTITILNEEVADRIGAQGPSKTLRIEGVAGARINDSTSQLVSIYIKGKHCDEEHCIDARTLPALSISGQTVQRTTIERCAHLQDIADQLVYTDAVPSILIGQDNWELLMTNSSRTGRHDEPVASLTGLGWVIHGLNGDIDHARVEVHRVTKLRDTDIDELVKEHFSLEALGIQARRPRSDPEERALKILRETTRRLPDGSFEVGLLWKQDDIKIPNNYDSALRRLESIERKLDKDAVLKTRYGEQMKRMIECGYAEIAPPILSSTKRWYLPHFPVINPSKPEKCRIVHDAKATYKQVALNDLLLTGPDLLQSLPGVLLRFRQRAVAVSADIRDMFLRISIKEDDRDALRFLWRGEERTGPPQEYRMKSVIFGATSSPATAIFVKNRNAEDFQLEFPEAAKAIERNHYMDDYLQSFSTIEEARLIAGQVDYIHRKGHFELQKWTSNEPAVIGKLASSPENSNKNSNKNFDNSGSEKILGLVWRPHEDTLSFNLNMSRVDPAIISGKKTPTKREMLRTAMSLFDPLGFVTPVTIQAKHILQETWRLGIDWDQDLPDELCIRWTKWLQDLEKLGKLALPRCYDGYDGASRRELHTFVDASETCYATAVFWRTTAPDGSIQVSLAAAKGRVCPLKKTSIPRLELQAAVLGCRLARTVTEENDEKPDRRIFWTDSKTVLSWLRAGPRAYKQFVAFRIAEIEENSTVAEWKWVPTKENVADDATRDIPNEFNENHRWFRGPNFLYQEENSWPTEPELHPETTGEEKTTTIKNFPKLSEALPDPTRFSSWLRLIRTTARVLQFINLCRPQKSSATRQRTRKNPEADPEWGKSKKIPKQEKSYKKTRPIDKFHILEAEFINEAEKLWLRAMQENSFSEEIRRVTGGSALQNDSRIKNLAVTIGDDRLLRVKSRIQATDDITPEQRSPVILDGSHPYCKLYIDWVHRELHHGGVETVVNEIMQRYWVIRLRPSVRGVLWSCQPCRLRRAKPASPPTGDLPRSRLAHHQRPFTFTGLDFLGPLSVTVGRQHHKRYVALFTCLTTRAIHLEVTASLSTDSCILALRRMMARRGRPTQIWSDNGTNLRGADAELRRALDDGELRTAAANRLITWRYITPSAPFMGGTWERLVRSVKTALRTTLHERHPSDEVLSTLLAEVEDTINSRPLTHLSTDDGQEALTPNHFLLGGPSRVPQPGTFDDSDLHAKKVWRTAQRLADIFWSRWIQEYLPQLQHRREPHGSGDALQVGDLVIVVDNTQPRNTWLRGLVVGVFPGPDGVVRTADIKTSNGILRRPTKKLVVLPTSMKQASRRENVHDAE